jgi:putative tryptophan/tyrosine transport system substrate-binding protein
MTRRTLGLLVTLAFLFVPLAAAAQPPLEKVYRIGRLSTSAAPAGPDPLLEAFRQGLRDFGYVEGRNIRLESRYAEGQEDRCPALAAELVRLPVDVLVAAGTAPIKAAQQATRTIPIVMA